MKKIEFIKDWRERKKGSRINFSDVAAANFVSQGIAKYVDEYRKEKPSKREEEKYYIRERKNGFKDLKDKVKFLDYLYDTFGDFDLVIGKKEIWSRWIKYSELLEHKDIETLIDKYNDKAVKISIKDFLNQSNYRSVFDVEIVFDVETKDKKILEEIRKELKEFSYTEYPTGGKGFHFHTVFFELKKYNIENRSNIKETVIKWLGSDLKKKDRRNLIGLEGTKHRNTEKLKICININKIGENKLKKEWIKELSVEDVGTQTKGEINEEANKILKEYKFDKNHPYLKYILDGNMIKEGTGGNSLILKQTAILFINNNLKDKEIEILGKALVNNCEQRTFGMFKGWLKSIRDGKTMAFFWKKGIDKWVKENDYDIPLYSKKEEDKKKKKLEIIKKGGEEREKISVKKITNEEILLLFYSNKMKEGVDMATKKILSENVLKTIPGTKIDVIYKYDEGFWQEIKASLIKKEIEGILGAETNNHITNEILGKIIRLTAINQSELGNVDKNLICLENGVYNIEKDILLPHSSKYEFLSKLPIKYDKDCECPKIKKFFDDIFYEEDINTIQELIGFLIYRKYFIKKSFILYGASNTGKTTFLNLLTKFIGNKNISGISLQKMAYDKFSTHSLYTKLANIYDDLDYKSVTATGVFKIACGGGYLTGEKKFGDTFQFINYAKMIFATNKIPDPKDIDDDAYYGRWIVILFDNVFEGEDKNPHLLDEILTEKELSGLFNWGMLGLKRLLENNKTSYNKTPEQVKKIMERSGSPILEFIDECIEYENGYEITKEKMFRAYRKYMENKTMPTLHKETLGKHLKKYCKRIDDGQNKQHKTIWKHFKLKKIDIFGNLDDNIKVDGELVKY